MLTIEIKFPAGRYHATPWGRNVNEGVVEWPPSPYRFARAIVDVWKRRRPDWEAERVLPILEAFSKPAYFSLPPATTTHTRSFLNSNQINPTAKQLIFDAFVAVDPQLAVYMGLDHQLLGNSLEDLDELLSELNFLGRSESWVKAGISKAVSEIQWNSVPSNMNEAGRDGEMVQVAGLLPPSGISEEGLESWLAGLCMTTAEFLKEGWSNPPVLKWIDYVRSPDALKPKPKLWIGKKSPELRCATYALSSTVLPSIKDTLPFAERIRAKLMGIHKRIMNGDPNLVSRLFSGKDEMGIPLKGHQHVCYQPHDKDGDGRLDHITITSQVPFNESELAALDRLRSIWQPDGRPDVKLVLVSLSASGSKQASTKWVSVTPFVTKRHYRKGRGRFDEWLASEIKKECSYRGIPSPSRVEFISHSLTGSHKFRWAEFIRSRKKSKPLRGYGCVLEFGSPIAGPFGIGAGCHFGLGLFGRYQG